MEQRRKSRHASIIVQERLMAIVGNEETCIGFLLAGIGENVNHKSNFLIVEKDTTNEEIEAFVVDTMQRPDIAILLVAIDVAARIQPLLQRYMRSVLPTMLVIPTKLLPYDPLTDPVVLAAKMLVSCEENQLS